MRRIGIITILVGVSVPWVSQGYVPTMTPSGHAVKWTGERLFNLAGNPVNQSGIAESFVFGAVVRGLQRWKAASAGMVDFDYWQGRNAQVYEPNSEYNGLSSLYFASQGGRMDSQVIGLTQVWYDQDSGNILEADVSLNDVDYVLTSDPTDTSGTGSGQPYSGFGSHIFLENVLTHELGHAMGLSHSGGLQSTMLYLESPEQAHLSCDDIQGIRSIYSKSLAGGQGEIVGRVLSPSNGAVAGAHVVALSGPRGVAVAYTLSDASGNFKLPALEPGSYSLMIEPYYAGASTLPAYYSSVNAAVCGGASFSRTFPVQGTGPRLKQYAVTSGGRVQAGDVKVACNGSRSAAVSGPSGGTSVGTAYALQTRSADTGFAIVDRATPGTFRYYKVTTTTGSIEVRALAFSLYSPVGVTLQLLDDAGNPVDDAQTASPVYSGESGYSNYDAAIVAHGLPAGDYVVRVDSPYVSSSRYPAGSVSMDLVPFMVLTGRTWQGSLPQQSVLPVNARCTMDEDFPSYKSPGGEPPRSDTSGSGVGFCGTVSAAAAKGGGPKPPVPPGAAVGWILPWLVMLAGARGIRLTVRKPRAAQLAGA